MRTPVPSRSTLARALAFGVVALAGASHAQIYKCVDRGGHTTYQQSPCTGGQQGGTVDVKEPVTVPSDTNAAAWSAAAREHRVVVGMPKPFVTEALGRPNEIRAPRSGESGSEVWVYPKPTQTTRLGFVDNAIAWIRNDVAPARTGAQAAGGTAPGVQREARVRDALVVGKTCTAALQDAGPADRDEPLAGGAFSGSRYVYTFDAANPNAYAAFVCLNGRVTSVERFIAGEAKPGGSTP
jgi:hypothetical protein